MSSRPNLLCLFFYVAAAGAACGKQGPAPVAQPPGQAASADAAPAPAPATRPLRLPLDDAIPRIGALPDRTSEAEQRTAWLSFTMDDPLAAAYRDEGKSAPFPRPWGTWAVYKTDFVGSLLRDGKIDFSIADGLYRGEFGRWDDRQEIVDILDAYVAKDGGDPARKANLVLGLIHVGFNDEALERVERFRDEPWFAKNWDVNFHTGALLFRQRRYAEAVPFLERAEAISSDPWAKIWLMLALSGRGGEGDRERAAQTFAYGAHMGGTSKAEGAFPFVDVGDQIGVRRWNLAGSIAFFDMDNDSFVDMLANGVWSKPERYRFEPTRGFVYTPDAILDGISNTPAGSVAADFDNDGYTDLYLTRGAWLSAGPNRLLENDEGRGFIDRSRKGDAALPFQNSCGVAALDYDRDGLVDLAVTGTAGGTLRLLKNKGDFVFEDVTVAAGIEEKTAITVGLSVGDVDDNGFPDIFVNSVSPLEGQDTRPMGPDRRKTPLPGTKKHVAPDALYMNQGDGTFVDNAEAAGVQWGTPVGFASWMFDHDNDGDLDILAANFVENPNDVLAGFLEVKPHGAQYAASALFDNDGTGKFENITAKTGFVPASIMGAIYIDYDLDGFEDVVLGPGRHALENAQPLFVYRNNGDDTFTNVTPLDDPHFFGKFHGMSFVDWDRDGDPDLYVNNGGVLLSDRWRDMFLRNETTGKRWLHLRLVGTRSNRSAIGARIRVYVGDRVLTRVVAAGQGFSSTVTPYVVFGLDQAEQADRVEIRWPNGHTQRLPAIAADQALVVTEDEADLKRIY